MISPEDLEARIQRLESIEAIRQLVQAYSFCVDDHDIEGIAECFSERARYRSADLLIDVSGRASIHDYFSKRMAALGPTSHLTHDHVIAMDASDRSLATGRVSSRAEVVVDGVPMCAALRYEDRYVFEQTRWRFHERTMYFIYYCAIEAYPGILGARRRKVMAGQRLAADIPEGLPQWRGQAPPDH